MLQPNETHLRWHWREMQVEVTYQFPVEEPVEPTAGSGWYDSRTGRLCIWSGTEWVCMPLD
jgi:hypothetical protein